MAPAKACPNQQQQVLSWYRSACFARVLYVLQVHCGDAAVEARLEQKINEACISFERKPQEVAQVRQQPAGCAG